MKIGFSGIALPEGKVKYNDSRMNALIEKDKPKKTAPFYVEFINNEYIHVDCIITSQDSLLDLLIHDMERCESRYERTDDEIEKQLLRKCINSMEHETPLCDCAFTIEENGLLRHLAPASFKPVVIVREIPDVHECIRRSLDKAGIIFFYTSGPREVHTWPVSRGSDIVTCADKIHTDLARGFIKGDVISFDRYIHCHSFNHAKKKGLVKEVDRGHIIADGDIIEIRFNV